MKRPDLSLNDSLGKNRFGSSPFHNMQERAWALPVMRLEISGRELVSGGSTRCLSGKRSFSQPLEVGANLQTWQVSVSPMFFHPSRGKNACPAD